MTPICNVQVYLVLAGIIIHEYRNLRLSLCKETCVFCMCVCGSGVCVCFGGLGGGGVILCFATVYK